jgi:hypothetical protein
VVEHITHLCVFAFEYGGIICAGHILLGHKYVIAQTLVQRHVRLTCLETEPG